MNELETYREILVGKSWDDNHNTEQMALRQGFDAAVALDLPVKFHSWAKDYPFGYKNHALNWHIQEQTGSQYPTDTQLYQYWIDNIYKLE